MAAPNIAQLASLYFKTKGGALTTSVADLLENTAGSGKVLRVVGVYVSNIDGANHVDATINFYDASAGGGTSYKLANTVNVPPDATLLPVVKNAPIHLEEGDKLTGLASANSDAEYVIAYEEMG